MTGDVNIGANLAVADMPAQSVFSSLHLVIVPNNLRSGLMWQFDVQGGNFGLLLTQDVPEPTTTVGFGTALASLFGLRRRRRKE